MEKLKLLFILMLFISSSVFSQWDEGGNPLNRFGVTKYTPGNNNFRSIGIGHKQSFWVDGWTTANPPRAALHVNDFYLDDPPSWVFTPGQVFRTDGPSNQDNMWQMFTGNNYGSSTEKARLSVPANTNDLVIEACMGHSNIRFNLVHDRQRAILTAGHGQGHLGVGDNFSDPQHMIHVHTSPTDVPTIPPSDIGFTNSNIGATENDGFIAGIEPDGTAFINQQEDRDIIFSTGAETNNHSRMVINGEEGDNQGFVGIGTEKPITALQVANGDIAVTAEASGIILKASNGENYFRVIVDNNGILYTEQVNFK